MLTVGAALGTLQFCYPASARAYQTIDPNSVQSFIGAWSPNDKPLCAALRSRADWDRLLHPAPVMGGNRPFSPAGFDWSKNAVLLVARVVPSGDTKSIFRLTGVEMAGKSTDVAYAFKPPAAASSAIKWYLAVVVPEPVSSKVTFVENGKSVCRLDLSKGEWSLPAPAQ